MPPGPWAMSVMMQTLHPSATPAANSVMPPAAVMLAILAGAEVNSVPSVNQRLPSDPLVMARGWLLAVGTLNCFSAPTGAASATLPSDNTRPTANVAASTRPAVRGMRLTPCTGRTGEASPRTPAAQERSGLVPTQRKHPTGRCLDLPDRCITDFHGLVTETGRKPIWRIESATLNRQPGLDLFLKFSVQGPVIEGFRNSDLWLCWSTHSHRETFEAGRRVGSLHPQGALLEPGLRPSDSRILPTWEGSLRNQQHPPATSHESRG